MLKRSRSPATSLRPQRRRNLQMNQQRKRRLLQHRHREQNLLQQQPQGTSQDQE